MKWDRWDLYAKDAEILPIKEPPCNKCKNFKPHRQYNSHGGFDGYVLCIVKEMYNDYSCYAEIRKKEEKA